MSNNINRYADFFPEYELEYVKKPYQQRTPIAPLQTGDHLAGFHIIRKNIIATSDILKSVNGSQPLTQLLDRPLVLVFHSIHWNGYGKKLLEDLNDLYADIRVMGGQLLLVTAEEKKYFDEATSDMQLPFATIWDQHYHIARKAGVYSPSDPIWDRISGVDQDTPTPAVFVLTPSLKIAYSSVDLYLEKSLNKRDILSAVYQASHQDSQSIAI
jgi:peroxiredoxin